MKTTFYLCFCVGLVAFVIMVFNLGAYPPIGSWSWVASTVVGIIVIPAAIAFVLDNCDRLTRYATFVMIMTVFVAATLVTLTEYFYLNGILDRNRSVEAQALVTQKFMNHGRYGYEFVLQLTFTWSGERFEYDNLDVSEETYIRTKPGDTVRIIIHPGKFSLPWYSDVLPPGAPARNARSDSRSGGPRLTFTPRSAQK